MDIDGPLDFESEDLLLKSPALTTKKRKKVIGLDDLVNDYLKENKKLEMKSKRAKAQKNYHEDEDEDKDDREAKLSECVEKCQKEMGQISDEDENSIWGLQVFGNQKTRPPAVFHELGSCGLLQSFMNNEINSLVELDVEKGEVFLERLLVNGWLLKLVYTCGHVEKSIATWTFGLMLYSSEEVLSTSACDFWTAILSPTSEVGLLQIKIDWLPNYSELKGALEIYGFILDSPSKFSSNMEIVTVDFGCGGPPQNIRAWIKYVASCCQVRSTYSILSTSEVEELVVLIINLFLDRQLVGLSVILYECMLSVINFFTDNEWNTSCETVAKSIACRVPRAVAIIDAYADKGLWAEAEAVFYRKRDLVGQSKDVAEFNVMVKVYGKAKLYDKALSLFKGMKKRGTWPDECTYNSLIQMLSGGDLVDEARDLLTEMQRVGHKPSCLTFSTVIASYAHLSRLSDAVDVYQEMVRTGVKPNEVVYGSLINGFAEASRVDEALHYFRIMEENGISVNQVVLTSMIKAYSKIDSVEGAKQMYQKMKDLEGGPDVVASNSMLSLYADLGMVSEARLVFDNLRDKGWADGVTFATMMYLYKNMGMFDEAIDVAEEMKQSGLLRDCVSFNKIMACYATNGQLVECGRLLHKMINQKLLPDGGTFKVLFTVLKKGGVSTEAVTQLESCYWEGKPFARQAVIACVFSVVGFHTLALESCEIFIKAEVGPDSFAYNVAIYAYAASGEIDKALNIFMKMQDEGLEPDLVTYINLVGCYGKAGMVEGVKRIYSRLKYGEIEPNESLFKAVIDAYKNVNRQDLAELVNQEMRFAFETQHYSDSGLEDDDSDETSLELAENV